MRDPRRIAVLQLADSLVLDVYKLTRLPHEVLVLAQEWPFLAIFVSLLAPRALELRRDPEPLRDRDAEAIEQNREVLFRS